MYTQCPECNTAFRITAEVLKQAAGKVRCGGCRSAFNALDYLSETRPEPTPSPLLQQDLPELTPDPPETGGSLPQTISAEQSAALLKTLDELAGADIRIEDTGVEWRVLDEDEQGEPAADEAPDEIATDSDEEPLPLEDLDDAVDDEAASTSVDELRFDDNTPLPEDFRPDEVEDAGEESDAPAAEPSQPEPEVDIDLSEPDEWTDILDEFEHLAEAVAASPEATEDTDDTQEPPAATAEVETPTTDDSGEQPLDMDAQFALQAEAMGLDLSGAHKAPTSENEAPPAEDEADTPDEDDDDLEALLDESGDDIGGLLDADLVDEAGDETLIDTMAGEELADDLADDLETSGSVAQLELIEAAAEDEDSAEVEALDAVIDDELDDEFDDEFDDELDDELDDDIGDLEGEGDLEPASGDAVESESEHYVPPMTKEEETINMLIDQDLLSMATEDDDGFASTIVTTEEEIAAADEDPAPVWPGAADPLQETGAGFETIVMEGDHVRSELEDDKFEADVAAAASLAGMAAADRETQIEVRSGSGRIGMILGIAALALLLAAQAVHQSRDTLATNATFNRIVGPAYRALGKPLSPEWDITGWRFEATRGSTDNEARQLTIFSRIGNKSKQALPYPLINISLTDRFEETIGARILDPADYLGNDLDPRKLVQPGSNFNAAITIESPATEATGFKLNVCYRETGGQLRCAIDDFK